MQDIKLPIKKEKLKKSNVENSQKTLYNSSESESGINEQIQQSGLLESNNGLSRIFEENGNQETKKYTRTEFE